MTNEEINRYIHVEIMGKCWHDWRSMGPDWGFRCGNDCGATSSFSCNPDYCSDDSPRSLLNEVVAKVRELDCYTYDKHLERICEAVALVEEQGVISWGDLLWKMLDATAEQIATACVEAHKATDKLRADPAESGE